MMTTGGGNVRRPGTQHYAPRPLAVLTYSCNFWMKRQPLQAAEKKCCASTGTQTKGKCLHLIEGQQHVLAPARGAAACACTCKKGSSMRMHLQEGQQHAHAPARGEAACACTCRGSTSKTHSLSCMPLKDQAPPSTTHASSATVFKACHCCTCKSAP
eukprot:1160005-Pelagomonas_calceolata.AAC.3